MTVAVIGAGALGRIAANIFDDEADVEFYDDDATKHGVTVDGYPVVADVASLLESDTPEYRPLVAIGNLETRISLYERFRDQGFEFARAVHPTASIAPSAEIGQGVVIKDQATVEPGAEIGANTIVGNGAIVCHDTTVEPHCRLAPGVTLAGHCSVGRESYLAVNASVDRTCTIGQRSIVASGCTIWEDVPADSVVKLPSDMNIEDRS